MIAIYIILVVTGLLAVAGIGVVSMFLLYIHHEDPPIIKEETIPDDWWSGGFASNH